MELERAIKLIYRNFYGKSKNHSMYHVISVKILSYYVLKEDILLTCFHFMVIAIFHDVKNKYQYIILNIHYYNFLYIFVIIKIFPKARCKISFSAIVFIIILIQTSMQTGSASFLYVFSLF
jgi:hypothetical protein